MREIILIKDGELALKGLNRGTFENVLDKTVKTRLKDIGKAKIFRSQSTLNIVPEDETYDLDEAVKRVSKIFGISRFSKAAQAPKDIDGIIITACEYLGNEFQKAKTFKVEAKRADKTFPFNSPQICAKTGEGILKAFNHLKVDVHNPDIVVNVEIRETAAYVHAPQLKGAGGMPVGTAGKAVILISGGIDSPVAAYMMAKRGLQLVAVHFASPPYTLPQAEEKVKSLLDKVGDFAGHIKLIVVPFTKIQEAIRDNCPTELFTVIMRRQMMKISEMAARNNDCLALITGESLGQVASQTLPAMYCTDNASTLPVLRPLVGFDKNDIVKISREIGTFDISIEPFEDCCTVFTPKHPKLRPNLEKVIEAENKISDKMRLQALEAAEIYEIKSRRKRNVC